MRLPPINQWPKLLRELAEQMDDSGAGALRLAQMFGGQTRHVPGVARPGQVIARTCGLDVARALAAIRGGELVDFPLIPTAKKAVRILQTEGSHNQVADAVGATRRYVKMVRTQARNDTPPPLLKIMNGEE